jgi:hypothetical protein
MEAFMKDNKEAESLKSNACEKLDYHKPELKKYGTLRTITLNPTPADNGESGLGVGYTETVLIDPNYDTGWSRHDRGTEGGRGRRGT